MFASRACAQQHSPVAAALATTNGPWAQGDALTLAAAVGANLIHLDNVQIHPTGFVDPKARLCHCIARSGPAETLLLSGASGTVWQA